MSDRAPTTSVHLALPALGADRPTDVLVSWLKAAGDSVAALEPIARLQDSESWLLLAPQECSGRITRLLVRSGASIVAYEPLVKIMVTRERDDGADEPGPRGLAESATPSSFGSAPTASGRSRLDESTTPFADAPLPGYVVVARIMPTNEIRIFAWIGVLTLVGLAGAALATILYTLLGGPLPPLFGGLSLAVAAAALAYGRQRLADSDG